MTRCCRCCSSPRSWTNPTGGPLIAIRGPRGPPRFYGVSINRPRPIGPAMDMEVMEALKTQVLENTSTEKASTKQCISQGWKTQVRKTQVRKMQVQCNSHSLFSSCLKRNVVDMTFFRSMLCIRGTSHGPVSVRPSVCLSVRHKSVFY